MGPHRSPRSAFTLVELSIVLVILGLLVGGVLTGQSLIRAAELRSVTTQYQRYQSAVMTFRDKYFALPGDMTNATAYWGASASGATCITTAAVGTATCNGDGNGQIDFTSAASKENFRFWQHLSNAGLIEGNYSGIDQGSSGQSSTTANVPAGRISGSLWYAQYFGTFSGNSYGFDGQYGNVFLFGNTVSNSSPYNPIFKPEEAYNIDTKIDDGKPATGKVVMYSSGYSNCTDASTSTTLTANYLLTNTTLTCALIFRQQF